MSQSIIDKADRSLASAQLLLEHKDADGDVSRAYYAMYDAARAAMDWAKIDGPKDGFKSHAGLIGFFGLHLVKTGRFSVELGRSINRVEELRSIADYLAEPVSLEKATQAVDEAQAFVAAVHVFLQSPQE